MSSRATTMVRDYEEAMEDDKLLIDVDGLRLSSIEDEEIEDYEEDESDEPVVLGFVENPKHKWSLLRHLFPSKAGGVPAWLDPLDLPTAILCDWCGSWNGVKECSSCKMAHYCSDIHQTTHWSAGHKSECCQTISSMSLESGSIGIKPISMERQRAAASKLLWPEKVIIQEDEEIESDKDLSLNKDDIDSYVPNDGLDDDSTNAFMDALEGDGDKKSWATFQERIGKAPEQVLRYCRTPGANPIWPVASGRLSKENIPKCKYCDGDSTFEFQILPQLLYYFGVQNDEDSIDWETIAVYTCQASCDGGPCDGGPSYKEEFAWVQQSNMKP